MKFCTTSFGNSHNIMDYMNENNNNFVDSGFRYFLLLVRPATVSNPQLVSSLAVDYNVEDADRNLDTQPLFEPEVTVNHSRQGGPYCDVA